MRIAICDDETGTCSEIENLILAFAKSHALQVATEVFYSGESLYVAILEQNCFDLVFLDIQLLRLDGVQIGKQIREQLGNEKLSIVYISSKESYAMSLFQVRPLDFLIKPITAQSIADILEKFLRLTQLNQQIFSFSMGKTINRLYLDEILYFACNGKKIEIYTASGIQEFYGGMQSVWEQVEGKGFWMIHKSFIVNSAFVAVYRYDAVQMTDKTILPISQRFRKSMKEHLTEAYRKG
ncbi:MAG: LytTR family DNA-binding domain-containing protein [Lachnospiraceae bacterium]|nr:LytTR family DNA-binding domain-containing protein [Lachnospiraceae bacterium]